MRDADDLISLAHRLDGKSYGAYKQLRDETFDYGDFRLTFNRIQSDPYAPPSQLSAHIPLEVAAIPQGLLEDVEGRIAAADFVARNFARMIRKNSQHRSPLGIASCGQEILERSSVRIIDNHIELRFHCQLPARGRRIMGHQFAHICDYDIPDSLFDSCDFTEQGPEAKEALTSHVHAYRDFVALQRILEENHWVAFVADQSILARESGISDRPMREAIPFISPDSLRVTFTLPHAGEVSGMAIEPGVTVIAGGGYHGKSTLLSALEKGVYAHIPGDGRELVATLPDAMKIRAEDGRAITGVDISLFINGLPGGADTTHFSTENASGSTSQAAAISEALEADVPVLLIDEDTSATNLMIRDERMRRLVRAEPITPLVDRVRELYERAGVSTIIVMGGSGDYLDQADRVVSLDTYRAYDVTEQAQRICAELPRRHGIEGQDEGAENAVEPTEGTQQADGIVPPHCLVKSRVGRYSPTGTQGKRARTRSKGTDTLTLDHTDIDISALSQIVDSGQSEAIAWAVRYLAEHGLEKASSVAEAVAALDQRISTEGLDSVADTRLPAFLARPRRVDIAAALSRYRALRLR